MITQADKPHTAAATDDLNHLETCPGIVTNTAAPAVYNRSKASDLTQTGVTVLPAAATRTPTAGKVPSTSGQ